MSETLSQLLHLLEQGRRRLGVRTLVLADSQGLMIAGAGRYSACEALAAQAPFLRHTGQARIAEVAGQEVTLCASHPISNGVCFEDVVDECRNALLRPVRSVA